MKIIKGGVTQPQGFLANGLSCGIKRSGKPDLSLIYSERASIAAGVFTKNSIKAAPLLVSQKHLRRHKARAVIANSGNANCFTGEFGLRYARQMASDTATALNVPEAEVLVASTGIIGKPLPIKKISDATPALTKGLSRKGGGLAARGILTTDTFVKEIAVQLSLGGKTVTIGACAKGSGMIEPDMATMLAFITTDAAVSALTLNTALREAVDKTFNSITVDGCMSTNDMAVVLANGLAKNKIIQNPTGRNYRKFCDALTYVCLDLAKKIIKDGEGATKFIEIYVKGASSEVVAKKVAKQIANSNLVKTAAFGSNPNWGRVAAAVGATGIPVTEKSLKISFSPFQKKEIRIRVDLQLGNKEAVIYTSDLSYEYVRINGEYT